MASHPNLLFCFRKHRQVHLIHRIVNSRIREPRSGIGLLRQITHAMRAIAQPTQINGGSEALWMGASPAIALVSQADGSFPSTVCDVQMKHVWDSRTQEMTMSVSASDHVSV